MDETLGTSNRSSCVFTDVQIELAEESLNPLFDDAHTAMYGSSAGLENGDSGDKTVSAQTESKKS